jgi:hypothetical protein
MKLFDFVNLETGVALRARLVRKGEYYGISARHNRNEPLIEFYDQRRAVDSSKNGQRIASYYADQFLAPHPSGLKLGEAGQGIWISPADCELIAGWLDVELKKPWVAIPPPPRPLPNTPTGPIPAAYRKVTIYLHAEKHGATWLEVRIAPEAQYTNAYHLEFVPKRARLKRRCKLSSSPQIVVLDGWNHPEFGLLKSVQDGEVPFVTIGLGAKPSPGEIQLGKYLEKLPESTILLDTRGVIIDEHGWTSRDTRGTL